MGDRKWLNLSFIALAAILAWIIHQAGLMIVRYAHLPNPKLLDVMPVSSVVAVLVAGLTVFFYQRQEKVQKFSLEVLQELKKVVWPGKKAAYLSTVVVVGTVIVAALLLGGFDWICTLVIGLVVKV